MWDLKSFLLICAEMPVETKYLFIPPQQNITFQKNKSCLSRVVVWNALSKGIMMRMNWTFQSTRCLPSQQNTFTELNSRAVSASSGRKMLALLFALVALFLLLTFSLLRESWTRNFGGIPRCETLNRSSWSVLKCPWKLNTSSYLLSKTSFFKVTEGSLEVKLPTIWIDGKAEVGRVREEKRREEKRREEKGREEKRREEKIREEKRREEKKREDQGSERMRRKKMQVRKKVARNSLGFSNDLWLRRVEK